MLFATSWQEQIYLSGSVSQPAYMLFTTKANLLIL
jgi:hypothetical protein